MKTPTHCPTEEVAHPNPGGHGGLKVKLRKWLAVVALGLCLAAEPGQAGDGNRKDRQAILVEVKRDMSADRVRTLLGGPNRVARQILYRKHLEQWVYEEPAPTRIEFSCVPSEEARVVSVRQIDQPNHR
jgi:hypothetical protein